jgi:hypothetical protein
VRVTGAVGEGVVAAVDRDPADHVALEAHRPGDRQRDPQPRAGREAAVRNEAMETDDDPQPGDGVEAGCQQHVGEPEAMSPQQPHRGRQPGKRQRDDQPVAITWSLRLPVQASAALPGKGPAPSYTAAAL